MTIINGIFFFLIFNKLSTYINPTWKWLSALEPSAFIALLALITTLVTFSITSMNNRKNSFENLFFHLISLLREILKLDENGSKNIKETLQKIEIESKNKLNSTNNTIKLNIHNENKQFVEESLVFLENLELQMESERRASIFQSGSVLEQTDIRKEIYLKHINTFSQLEEYFRANNKYEVYTTELTALRTENYDSITEQLLQNYNSINSTKRDLFSLFSTKQEAIPFVDLINDLCDKFPENLDHLKNIETRMHAAFSSENVHLKTEISEKEKREIISSFLSRNEFGSFFRTIHRIIKIILSFSILKRPKTINKYLGILRTQLSEEQLLLLFYNAEYTKRGEKFKKNVSNVNLWGDLDELDTSDDKEPTHFKSSALIWPENDLKILRTKYVKK